LFIIISAALMGVLGVLQHPGPQFWGTRNWWEWTIFYVLCITETCKIWALAAAEQRQKYIRT